MSLPMRHPFLTSLALALGLSVTSAGWADSFRSGGMPYKGVTIIGVKDGKLLATVGGAERSYDLKEIDSISIDGLTAFNNAEANRGDPAKARTMYINALKATTNAKLKQVVQARALSFLDTKETWLDGLRAFLDLYQASPTEATYALRPQNLPDAKSTLLDDGANLINGKLSVLAKNAEAQKNLYNMLLEIYNKKGDTKKASEIAAKLGVDAGTVKPPEGTGGTASGVNTGSTGATGGTSSGGEGSAKDAEIALNAKQYDKAIAAADAALATAQGDAAIRLYQTKAKAYTALKKPNEAAAAYLRIAAFYPNNKVAAADALLQAGMLQKEQKNDDAARRLFREIVEKYKETPAALQAQRLAQ